MRATGIAQAGCRWIAVRHAEDHIHLVASLVSEETGRRFEPYRDFLKLRDECRAIERDLGLVGTAPIDRTAAPAPTRGELAKAARLGRAEPVRLELRRRVSRCAAAAHDSESFLAGLAHDGLGPQVVRDRDGRIVGYTVGHLDARTRDGRFVRYSGRALAPDLTWPTLQARWATVDRPAELPRNALGVVPRDVRAQVLAEATTAVQRAGTALHTEPAAVAHAAGELLHVLARRSESLTIGPLTTVADRYDRAARARPASSSHPARPAASRRNCGRLPAVSPALSASGTTPPSPVWRCCSPWPRWSPRSPPGTSRASVPSRPGRRAPARQRCPS